MKTLKYYNIIVDKSNDTVKECMENLVDAILNSIGRLSNEEVKNIASIKITNFGDIMEANMTLKRNGHKND